MSDDVKNTIGQFSAWFAGAIGVISFEMWLAIAGLVISGFMAWTNYRSRAIQDRLLLEEAKRSVELHNIEMRRIRDGVNVPPAVNRPIVKELVRESTSAACQNE